MFGLLEALRGSTSRLLEFLYGRWSNTLPVGVAKVVECLDMAVRPVPKRERLLAGLSELFLDFVDVDDEAISPVDEVTRRLEVGGGRQVAFGLVVGGNVCLPGFESVQNLGEFVEIVRFGLEGLRGMFLAKGLEHASSLGDAVGERVTIGCE